MTASIAALASARHLPRPAPGRLRPLRAGIRNVWEYDDQEFWFSDGRLILRGQNTAGKSKALELLFPFVLDGDIRPQRLDPFGSVSKTMYWNLIDFCDRNTAIGYCWAEFGHVDAEGIDRFVTCIVGMRATRSAGRRVDTWFAVTPARVGLDLDLAPAGVPLPADKLRSALPEPSTFSTAAKDHRTAVDQALFGLGIDRYEALVHLLLQLRRPKLSEKLDVPRLGEYLSDALPPLERDRMEKLATAFAHLDEQEATLERLEESARALHVFLDHYRAHARIQMRRRADDVRAANSQFDRVTEIERTQRATHERATSELEAIDIRLGELQVTVTETEGQLAGLDLSKVHALEEVVRRARDADKVAVVAERRAEDDRDLAEHDGRGADEAERAATDLTGARDLASAAARDRSTGAGVAVEHELHAGQLDSEPDRALVALRGVAERRTRILEAVRTAALAAGEARRRIDAGRVLAEQADEALDRATARSLQCEAALAGAIDDLVVALATWAQRWGVAVPDDHVAAEVDGRRPGPRPLLARERTALQARRTDGERARALTTGRRDEARAERHRVEEEKEMAPPARPGRPAVRPEGFVPLWACVDFEPALGDPDRAGLEAGLEAAGVLDALVAPDGNLLDPATLDTLVDSPRGAAGAEGALDGAAIAGLVPLGGVGSAAGRALAALGRAGTWDVDGSWSFGALRGRWAKPVAEYVGAAARVDARRRRLAGLDDEIRGAEDELALIEAALVEVDAAWSRLDAAEEAWPTGDEVRDARRDAVRQADEVATSAAAAERAREALGQARSDGRAALDALADAEGSAACEAGAVDGALASVADYREAVSDAANAARLAIDAASAADEQRTRARASALRADRSAGEAAEARVAALTANAEAAELERTSGADAATVLDRQQELKGLLEDTRDEATVQRKRRDEARDQVAKAEAHLERTKADRIGREEERASALRRLAALAPTELAVLALGPVDTDRDLSQVTAGLGFARAAYDQLRDVAVDQPAADAVATRFHNGLTTLLAQLGVDFNPFLDTSDGLEVCFATLNGRIVPLSELSGSIDDQVRRRRETLTAEERALIHQHLLAEVGSHLGDQVHAAWALTRRMNEQLAAHPTRGGVRLELTWELAPDAGPGAEEAMRLLRQDVRILAEAQRAALAAFLHERVRAAREDAEGADMVERLAAALDYRRWHRFVVYRLADGTRQKLTSRSQGVGSGGEQAKLVHLPLFAATAAYYASARAEAPHLLMLDEAFAGIDDSQRGDCMGMLVDLDLDMVLTNYAEWGCYPEIPSVATYHLERTPGQLGVAALRFVWDGTARAEDDPWLEDREAGRNGVDGGLFA